MSKQQNFIKLIMPFAVASMKNNKILASITIAQACLETGYGTSALMMKYNAPFGVKATPSWLNAGGKAFNAVTGEVYNGVNVTITAAFRAYNELAEAVEDHAAILRLSFYNKSKGGKVPYDIIGETDYRKAAQCLSPYATDPLYVQKIIKIIETNKLTQYDNTQNTGDLTVTQYEELKKLIEKLNKDLDGSKIKYAYVDKNMPDWARPTIGKMVDKGYLKGDENGKLNLSDNDLKIYVAFDRAGGVK